MDKQLKILPRVALDCYFLPQNPRTHRSLQYGEDRSLLCLYAVHKFRLRKCFIHYWHRGHDAIDHFRAELEVNAFGLLRMSQAFAPILKKNGGGAIANMLSVVSWFVYPFNATYCASKFAALGISEGLRTQLRSQGTHVTAVYAGFVDTDMAAKANAPKTTPLQVAEKTLEGIEKELDHVHSDSQSENYWEQLKEDRGLSKAMQEVWSSGASVFA